MFKSRMERKETKVKRVNYLENQYGIAHSYNEKKPKECLCFPYEDIFNIFSLNAIQGRWQFILK